MRPHAPIVELLLPRPQGPRRNSSRKHAGKEPFRTATGRSHLHLVTDASETSCCRAVLARNHFIFPSPR